MNKLMQALERCRERDNLSLLALSKRLRVSDAYLTMARNGKRKVGLPILCGIAREYRELDDDILEYLRDGHEDDA